MAAKSPIDLRGLYEVEVVFRAVAETLGRYDAGTLPVTNPQSPVTTNPQSLIPTQKVLREGVQCLLCFSLTTGLLQSR